MRTLMLLGLAACGLAISLGSGRAQARDPDHHRLHDELEHRAFHRHLYHRQAHRYPMTWWQHEALHEALEYEAFHDRLAHRAYHRHRDAYRYSIPYRCYDRGVGIEGRRFYLWLGY